MVKYSDVVGRDVNKTSNSIIKASRVTKDVLDVVIAKELKNAKKYPKAVQKWLSKLRLSLVSKVISCSQPAFCPENETVAYLEAEMNQTSRQIRLKMDEVRRLESQQESRDLDILSRTLIPVKRSFQDSIPELSASLEKTAAQMQTLSQVSETRILQFAATVGTIDRAWYQTKMSLGHVNIVPDSNDDVGLATLHSHLSEDF